MATRDLVILPDKQLRLISNPVEAITRDIRALADDMLETAEKFGFSDDDYLRDLAPQAASVFPEDMNEPETGQSGIGQFDVRATPLQMAMVAAGIANQGTVMRPYVVDEVQSADYDVIDKIEPEKYSDAVSATTASEVTKLMVETVDNGTASPAAIHPPLPSPRTPTPSSRESTEKASN